MENKKLKILIVQYGNADSEPRLLRQIYALKDEFELETLSYAPCNIDNITNHNIYEEPKRNIIRKIKRSTQYLFRFYDQFYWNLYRLKLLSFFKNHDYDVIISHDIPTLPLCLAISDGKSKVIFDSHDYHPAEFDENLAWVLFEKPFIIYLCKKYIPKVDLFITSSIGIAEEYHKLLNIMPKVITNARAYCQLEPSSVDEKKIRMVHHGAAISGRKIEKMIEVQKKLGENYELHLYLTGEGSPYYKKLINKSLGHNVFFHKPVSYNNIVREINQYDIGLYLMSIPNLNNYIAIPNKIYEFIQARLCCVVSPTIELKRIVNENNVGIVSCDFTSEVMAAEIKKLSANQIFEYKYACNIAAKQLSSDENLKLIREYVKDVL